MSPMPDSKHCSPRRAAGADRLMDDPDEQAADGRLKQAQLRLAQKLLDLFDGDTEAFSVAGRGE